MRRKTADKTKTSPEKSSRRTSRRGRKSPTVSPERSEEHDKDRPEEEEGTKDKEITEPRKTVASDSEQEEGQKKYRSRKSSRAKASEERIITKPRRSSRRKSQSVEPSDNEESEREENGQNEAEKDSTMMETIPEEHPEELPTSVDEPVERHATDQVDADEEKRDSEEVAKVGDNSDSEHQNGANVEPEETRDTVLTKTDVCEQSRESGEVDYESVQEDDSQQAVSKKEEKNEDKKKETSEDDSSSEKYQRKSESPKPVRKSRFRSRTKSPVAKDVTEKKEDQETGGNANDEELEAGEIKEDPVPKRSPEKKTTDENVVRKPLQRRRRWLSSKPDTKSSVIAISTDSLKNIISEPVKPVPLSDVKLESSPEPEEIIDSNEEQPTGERRRSKDKQQDKSKKSDNENVEHGTEQEFKMKPGVEKAVAVARKISIVSDDGSNAVARPPSPARHHSSNILYITNLVRPFTVLQLKGLLARTGKIVENGFWIDKIKSKCYVKYETEDEAVETRHALHGVRWPVSNPKCLNVDFGTEAAMEKAIISTLDDTGTTRITIENAKDTKEFGWSRDTLMQAEDTHVIRPVREWDLGKKDAFEHDRERVEVDRSGRSENRDRERERDRDRERERDRDRERIGRIDEGRPDRVATAGRRRSAERDFARDRDRRRNSTSLSPARKFKKKENEPPIRLLDDLFRKTKTTPCIYWLPLTAEQIATKEEQRRKILAETQRRQEEARKQEEERRKERERRDRERRERPRSNSRDRRRRSRSRDDGRRRHR
ncbi:apoptotic chromatin condensation inducer in the nucleus [Toxorhynchites rutilus septentrionalis]|uniref:apoptotic chromatin condensation inducer in the nucleus n=1 Tax=Toxorhynchites rutilus septentrionalis TaxID=329112 RepID=UPI00247A5B1B|nr:apoptotic chromatin condensation inducer in the nucleus [Toxorhynchites rutilus septentrionalis]